MPKAGPFGFGYTGRPRTDDGFARIAPVHEDTPRRRRTMKLLQRTTTQPQPPGPTAAQLRARAEHFKRAEASYRKMALVAFGVQRTEYTMRAIENMAAAADLEWEAGRRAVEERNNG